MTTGTATTATNDQETTQSVELQAEVLSSVVLGDLNEESTSSSTSSGTFQQPLSNVGSVNEDAAGASQSNVNMSDDDVEAIEVDDKPVTSQPGVVNRSKKRTAVPQNMGRSRHGLLKKDQCVLLDGMKFMAEFDPSNSSRNQQKKKKRYHPVDGRLIQYADDYDICDCLQPMCPGCHYPCKSCGDNRCGKECRIQRKWMYDSLEIDGRDKEIKNPHSSAFI